jgi:hypothetical protein
LLAALALSCAAAGGAIAADPWFRRPEAAQREFQQLLGGLGCGPAVNLAECELAFDPRLDGACTADCGPIPGGHWFCGRHACSLLPLRPLSAATLPPVQLDAQVP